MSLKNKAVLFSIRPGWCCQIAAGKKTVEIRRNAPSLDFPFRCYIYCTQATPLLAWQERWSPDKKAFRKEVWPVHGCGRERAENLFELLNGKVIGTFVCDKIDRLAHVGTMGSNEPAKLYIETPDLQYEYPDELLRAACLSEADVEGYLKGGDGFGWHISDLKIYDQPKSLSGFSRHDFRGMNGTDVCGNESCEHYQPSGSYMLPPTCAINGCCLSKPPQSWCYVAEAKEDDAL